MPRSDNVDAIDAQLNSLREEISDLARQIDAHKTKTAAALGGGGFLLFLAAGAAYDLWVNNGEVWLTRGITRETLTWAAVGFACGSILSLGYAFARIRNRDRSLEEKLDQLEQEYAELLDRNEARGAVPD